MILEIVILLPLAFAKMVYLIRHGEKPEKGIHLSSLGWQRAFCVEQIFSQPNQEFLKPSRLIAHPAGGGHSSTRPVDTLKPLADKLQISIEQSCLGNEYDCIYDSIMKDSLTTLVSWEHKRLRKIVKKLLPNHSKLPHYPSSRFDIIWAVDTEKQSFTEFLQNCPERPSNNPYAKDLSFADYILP